MIGKPQIYKIVKQKNVTPYKCTTLPLFQNFVPRNETTVIFFPLNNFEKAT